MSLGRELEDTSAAGSERTSRLSRRRLECHILARRQVEELVATATRLHAARANAGDSDEAGAHALEGLTLHGRFLLNGYRAPKASLGSRHGKSRRAANTRVATGLKCAPEIAPRA